LRILGHRLWMFAGFGVRFVSRYIVQFVHECFHAYPFCNQMFKTFLKKSSKTLIHNHLHCTPTSAEYNRQIDIHFFEVFHGVRIERETYTHYKRTKAADNFLNLFILKTIRLYIYIYKCIRYTKTCTNSYIFKTNNMYIYIYLCTQKDECSYIHTTSSKQ